MTISEHMQLSAAAVANVTAAYPMAFVEEQSDGYPDPNAVIVVYERLADRRYTAGYRYVPMGAVPMLAAAKGDVRLRKELRGWDGR